MKKGMLTILATIATLAIGLGTANATSVNDALFVGSQGLSDNSAEIVIKGDGNDEEDILEVGDILRGVFRIDSIEDFEGSGDSFLIGDGTPFNELTGIFEIEVTGKVFASGSWTFTFGPSTGDFKDDCELFGWADCTRAVVALFEDPARDFTRAGDWGDIEDSATGGSLFWLFGMDTDDDFWFAVTSTDDLSVIGGLVFPDTGGSLQFGLTLFDRLAGPDLNDITCLFGSTTVHACGQGNLLGTEGTTDAVLFNDVNIRINVIPEPGSLALLGFGLLGLGALARRRKRA